MYVWGSGNSGKWLGMYAGCVRFCPADSALGVTGGFVTGAEIYRIQTQVKKLSSQPRHQISVATINTQFPNPHQSTAEHPLTGSYNHPLWSLGVHRQGVCIETCGETNWLKHVLCITCSQSLIHMLVSSGTHPFQWAWPLCLTGLGHFWRCVRSKL